MTDPLMVARAVQLASTAMVVGAMFFRLLVLEPAVRTAGAETPVAKPVQRALTWIVWIGLAVALVSAVAWLIFIARQITGRPLSAVLVENVWWTVLTQTQFGRDWQIRLALIVLLGLTLLLERLSNLRRSRLMVALEAAFGAGLMGSLAWAGHGASTEGASSNIHLVADVLHLLAAAAWLGALIPLAILFISAQHNEDGQSATATLTATTRFSTIGIISVGVLLATGIVNTWFLSGSIPALVGTEYGRLLSIKIALFAVMVVIAAINRLELTPRLARGFTTKRRKYALYQLARNCLIEVSLAVGILAIVGVLGAIPPGLHQQVTWPWPVRLSDEVWSDPQLRAQFVLVATAAAAGALLIVGALSLQGRRRWMMAIASLGALYFVASRAGSFTVPAFPTSFDASPTGYSAASIARGHALYEQHCAGCHGGDGRGGSAAGQSADLTADHIYDHSDGDLFWWISNGIGKAMPPLAAAIDEEGRWNLIDFIHANADAVRLRISGNHRAFRLPDFSADCPGGASISPADLHGSVVHVVIAGPKTVDRLRELVGPSLANDVKTIAVFLDQQPIEDLPFCVANGPDVARAFAIYSGKDPADIEGTEFLADAGGQLRAMWYPGLDPDWSDASVFEHEITGVREPAAAPMPMPISHHHAH